VPSGSALIRAAIDHWMLISVDSRRICRTVNAYAASPHRRLKLDPGPWLGPGRLLHEVAGTQLAPNSIPATPVDAFVGDGVGPNASFWWRESQDARRAISAASPVVFQFELRPLGG
jgi:hypothetical protein